MNIEHSNAYEGEHTPCDVLRSGVNRTAAKMKNCHMIDLLKSHRGVTPYQRGSNAVAMQCKAGVEGWKCQITMMREASIKACRAVESKFKERQNMYTAINQARCTKLANTCSASNK